MANISYRKLKNIYRSLFDEGGGAPKSGVKAGEVTVNFPELPKPNKSPITINTPEAAYP